METNRNLSPEGREYVEKVKNLLRDFDIEFDDAKEAALARKLAGEEVELRGTRHDLEARHRLVDAGRNLPVMAPGVDALGGGVLAAIPINYDFKYRAIPELLGLHDDWQCGVGYMKPPDGGPKVAICMISGSGYINRDLGGLAESYMGVDTVVLPAPGRGNQRWTDAFVAPLVRTHESGSAVWLLRQHDVNGEKRYRFCGAYRIIKRWRTRVAFVEGQGGEKGPLGNIQCFFKLERLPGQAPLRPVAPPKDQNPPKNKGAKPQPKRRRMQIRNSRAIFTGKETTGNAPELCVNCLMEGDGREDILVCEGCAARLAEGAPRPEPCERHECWKRPQGCVHTAPALLCFECVDLGDMAKAKRTDTAWACAACADRFDLWGDVEHTDSGMLLLSETMAAAMARHGVAAAALPARAAHPSTPAAPDEPTRPAAAQKRKAVKEDEAGPSRMAPARRRQRRAAGGEAGPSAGAAQPMAAELPSTSFQGQIAATEVISDASDDEGGEVASPSGAQAPAAAAPAAAAAPSPAAAAAPAVAVTIKREPRTSSKTCDAATVPAAAAIQSPPLSAVTTLLQGCPAVLVGRYAAKYRSLSPEGRQEDYDYLRLMSQIDDAAVHAFVRDRVGA